ncbi:NEDD4 family-interacting protein 2 [Dasypus novemcinctus]|uniref:NEDD4 family-interacting protein 2 n=1 Tax=Dasypus novemcinctus TaxID=9361 RepID=UPI00265DD3A0|nr:NEDD4 family-interacting protein 2 [Dasypus novemcinctus]
MTVNYKELNKVTPSLFATEPNIAQLLDDIILHLGPYHFVLDLANAFFSIAIDPLSQDQFAFTWEVCQWTFQVLPQSYLHSPTLCHGLVAADLKKWKKPSAVIMFHYIDDVMLTSNDLSILTEASESLFAHLTAAGWAKNCSKLQGPGLSVKYLGVVWSVPSVSNKKQDLLGKEATYPQKSPIKDGDIVFRSFCHRPLPQADRLSGLLVRFHLLPPSETLPLATRLGRLRTRRACAAVPSMLSIALQPCGASELLRGSETDAEVFAAAAGATGSEAAQRGESGGRNTSGRGAAASATETGVAEEAERGGDLPAPTPASESSRMDLHQSGSGRYQVLHNEEDNSESSAIEQPSTSSPAPQIVQLASSAPVLETDSSPPPYSSITVEVPTTSDTEVYNEFYPVPPPYSVATSLPTYDEAEKAKAAAMAAAAAETSQRVQEEEYPPRDDFNEADQLRVGNDGIFMLAFFMAFIFNWLGFCLSFCITNTIAGRYGAICGFGLSLIKWILIVRFSDYFTGYFNGQYWLWWIFLVLGLLLFFRGFVNYLKVRNMSESMAAAHRTRYFFLL